MNSVDKIESIYSNVLDVINLYVYYGGCCIIMINCDTGMCWVNLPSDMCDTINACPLFWLMLDNGVDITLNANKIIDFIMNYMGYYNS